MSDDSETRAAVEALVYRLRNRGDADDEPFAREFITALEERGWRPPLAPATEAGEDGTREAARELLAFACATRPDWTEDETRSTPRGRPDSTGAGSPCAW